MSISKKRLKKIAQIKDSEIDYSDIAKLNQNFWKNAEVSLPKNKQAISLRVDPDVLEWFKSYGRGYQSRINAVLRSYYEAHKDKKTA